MSKHDPYVTPTYQSNLNAAWRDIVDSLSVSDYLHAWDCTQIFFKAIAPPKVEKECIEDYEALEKKMLDAQDGDGGVSYENVVLTHNACVGILKSDLQPFLKKLKHSLFAHGYFESKPVEPRAGGAGRLKIE